MPSSSSQDDRQTKPARSRTTTGDTRDLLWQCLKFGTDSIYTPVPPRSVADSTLHQNVRANLAPNEVGQKTKALRRKSQKMNIKRLNVAVA